MYTTETFPDSGEDIYIRMIRMCKQFSRLQRGDYFSEWGLFCTMSTTYVKIFEFTSTREYA